MHNTGLIETWINSQINKKGYTKKLIYDGVGITQSGFDKMIKRESLTLMRFAEICQFANFNPCDFFQFLQSEKMDLSAAAEPIEIYAKKEESKELDFARKEIDYLKRENKLLKELVEAKDKLIQQNNIIKP